MTNRYCPGVRHAAALAALLLIVFLGSAVAETSLESGLYGQLVKLHAEESGGGVRYMLRLLAEASGEDLLSSAEQASSAKDSIILYALIGPEVVRRLEASQLTSSCLLDELSSTHGNDTYEYFLIMTLNAASRSYSAEAMRDVFVAAQKHIRADRSSTPGQRLAALVTCNSMMAELVAAGRTESVPVDEYASQLLSIAGDWSEDPAIRRAAVKGISEIRFENTIPDLLLLLSDERILDDSPVARSVCVALGRFRAVEAIAGIQCVLERTDDEGVFASAAIALAGIGGEDALKAIVGNATRFGGTYTSIAIRKLDALVFDLLSGDNELMLPYAVEATGYLSDEGQRDRAKEILKDIIFRTENADLVRTILITLQQLLDPDEAQEIAGRIPVSPSYAAQFLSLKALAGSVVPRWSPGGGPVKTPSSTSGQEYGDAAYKELDLIWPINGLGHGGLFAGVDNADRLRIVEVGVDMADPLLRDVVHHNNFANMLEDEGFWGVFTLSNRTLTFAERQATMETAFTMYALDIGYPIDILLPGGDMLQYYSGPGDQISPEEIDNIRCDGLVEYCYEYNGLMVWGENAIGDYYDISQTVNVDRHNTLYWVEQVVPGPDPNTGLAPSVQCGRAGGTSTYMTRTASSGVELPEYQTSYAQIGSSVYFFVEATDESGIHRIYCKPPGYTEYIAGETLFQHPISDHFTQQFDFPMSESGEVLYYAIDNGGNGGPEFAEGAWVEFSSAEEIRTETTPESFTVSQNYPNPFNSSTTIEFTLGRNSFVTVDIFNVLGERVRRLVSEQLSTGKWKVAWDATGDDGVTLSSGVYFYRARADHMSIVKKLLLLR